MTRERVYEILVEIFRDIFDDDNIDINDNTTADDISDWDSYEHINLLVSIENRFKIKFDMKKVIVLKNVGDIVDCIIERL